MAKKIILIGGGGHCKSCIDVIEQEGSFNIEGVLDVKKKVGGKILDYRVIGTDEDIPDLVKDGHLFFITLGHILNAEKRISIFNSLKAMGLKIPTITSPTAYISRTAKIGEGTIIMHHALINSDAVIGSNCIINSKALIEHDAIVNDHCHISTATIINGGVRVGAGSFVGSGATTKQNTSIPSNSFIKANSIYKG